MARHSAIRSQLGVAESRYETVIVMLNEVARSEASGEILRSPLWRSE
jgi:hypothetical protein